MPEHDDNLVTPKPPRKRPTPDPATLSDNSRRALADRNDPRKWLDQAHARELIDGSAIADHIIIGRGYSSIRRRDLSSYNAQQQLSVLGIPKWATELEARYYPGLLIPLYRPTGERVSYTYKPAKPVVDADGKPRKYAAAKNRPAVVDVHPINRDRIVDPTVELWITEGVKKADSLTSQGLCVAALAGVYNWRSTMGSLGDWEDIPLRGRTVVICFDADATVKPAVHKAMLRLGNWLRSKGAEPRYLITPDNYGGTPTKGADDYLAAGGTLSELRSFITVAQPRTDSDLSDTFTDARMAETIAEDVFDGKHCWTGGLGWMQWINTGRWRPCTEKTVGDAVRRYCLDRFSAAVLDRENRSSIVIDGWKTMLGAGRERSVTGLAMGIVEKRADDFDRDPDLLNTPTGIVDLTSGELGPHDPDLLMRRQTNIGYRPDARHDDWDKALTCIPDDVRDYLQIRLGQGITGHPPPDDALMILRGGGENGKSTLANTIRKVLGDYFVLVSNRVLMGSPDAHPTELMDFQGARYAVLEETPEARRLDVQRLKQIVGTPVITARHIRKDDVTFETTHTLFINTNHKPIVDETDHGTWRRLLMVNFPYRYRKGHEALEGPNDRWGDPTLRDRCATDRAVWEACLAWLIDGARKWYEGGKVMPAPPQRVLDDTLAWRKESDLLLTYFGERLTHDPASHVLAADLLDDYNQWLKSGGHNTWTDRTFKARLAAHDLIGGSRVAYKVVRHKNKQTTLSRRPVDSWSGDPYSPHAPKPLSGSMGKAWVGLRFADGPEELSENDLTSDDTGFVTGVTASSDNTAEALREGLFGNAVTTVTNSGQPSTVTDEPNQTELAQFLPPTEGISGNERCGRCHMTRTSLVHRNHCEGDAQ